jgi:uncharacterized protein
MTHQEIIDKTTAYVKAELANAEGGHDWWHIYRVWSTAKEIASHESCDRLVVELAALLHDIADSKFHGGDEDVGPQKAQAFLETIDVDSDTIDHVIHIIRNISYKGGKVERSFTSKELDIVQDADRLDAIGAIGIARAFSYGGFKGRAFYDPAIAPDLHMSKEQYKNSGAPTINHFYEKLLSLKDLMNTETGKAMAQARHEFMLTYLDQFYKEWEGKS